MKARVGRFLLLAGLVAWIYGPALRGEWIWDDEVEIPLNSLLRSGAGLGQIWQGRAGPDYFPLKSTLQWLEWHLWGGNVLGYHLVNVGLHLLSACLIWRLLVRLGVGEGCAWFGGALFAVHPLAVESVAWISEFKNTLSLPPLLLAFGAWMDWEGRAGRLAPPGDSAARAGPPYLKALAWFLVALLCKTSVVMFPAILLLYAWWRRGRVRWRDLAATLPFFALALGFGWLTLHFHNERAIAGVDLHLGGRRERLAAAGQALVFYFDRAVFPAAWAPVYPRWLVRPGALAAFLPWLAAAGPITWLIARAARRPVGDGARSTKMASECESRRDGADGRPSGQSATQRASVSSAPSAVGENLAASATGTRSAAFGLGAFLLPLLPVAGLIPMSYLIVSRAADHFAYLSLAALAALGGAAALAASRSPRIPKSMTWTAGLALWAGLAAASRSEAAHYRRGEDFWTWALARNPSSWTAENNLGKLLMEQGRGPEAAAHFSRSISLLRENAVAHFNLGLLEERRGRLAEAVREDEAALRLQPDSPEALRSLGSALLHSGRPQAAEAELLHLLRLRPDDAEAWDDLGIARGEQGRLPEGLAAFDRAVGLKPDDAQAWHNRGLALTSLGRLEEAVASYRQSLRLRPNYAEAHNNMGVALIRLGRFGEARREFEEALRVDPASAEAKANLGTLGATQQSR